MVPDLWSPIIIVLVWYGVVIVRLSAVFELLSNRIKSAVIGQGNPAYAYVGTLFAFTSTR